MTKLLLITLTLMSLALVSVLPSAVAAETGIRKKKYKRNVPTLSSVTNFNHNFFIGTQAVYAPQWRSYRVAPYSSHTYSEPGFDMLTEFREGVALTGLNHFKLKLATNTCESYRLPCDSSQIQSMTELSQVPEIAATLADPNFRWYHVWAYSYSLPDKLKSSFTEEQVNAEYQEIYDWAAHILQTYANTGKMFFLGNWEGDWELLGSSGCRSGGKYDLTCAPSSEIIDKYVQWTSTRQAAINAAKADYGTNGVNIFFYIEFNLAEENFDAHPIMPGAVRPTILNSVVPAVNPDFVSYSSYKSTNKYMDHQGKWFNQRVVDERFWTVLEYAQNKLSPTGTDLTPVLGDLTKRVFIGEFSPVNTRDAALFVPSAAQVFRASLEWGCPFVVHWATYDNDSNAVPLLPRDSHDINAFSPLRKLFKEYTDAAKVFAFEADPTPNELRWWAVEWFRSAYS